MNIFEEKSSSRLVQKNKFHNLLNAATKPKTPPKDRNIPKSLTKDGPGMIYWDCQGLIGTECDMILAIFSDLWKRLQKYLKCILERLENVNFS